MVVAVQQRLAESTAIFNVCIVEYCPAPFTVKIHKTCTSAVEQIPIPCPLPRSKVNVPRSKSRLNHKGMVTIPRIKVDRVWLGIPCLWEFRSGLHCGTHFETPYGDSDLLMKEKQLALFIYLLQILREYGGIYLDNDCMVINDITNLRKHHCVVATNSEERFLGKYVVHNDRLVMPWCFIVLLRLVVSCNLWL